MHRCARLILSCTCLAAVLRADAGAQEVVPRRGTSQVVGGVRGVDDQGVMVGEDSALIPWDSVASVAGEWSAASRVYNKAAEDLWRARIRLERGDLAGAEPLFEHHFPAYSTSKGPTSQLVCGGLLMCRLARGAQVSAVGPFLAYLASVDGGEVRRIIRGGDITDPADLSPIDWTFGLAPNLPPVWLSGPGVQSLARGAWPAHSGRIGTLSMLYQLSACSEAGIAAEVPARPGNDEGAALVWDVVVARAGDAIQRVKAREHLRARAAEPTAPWVQAWVRTGLGRSLLKESDTESRLLGMAELAAVPAAFERVCPYLTGVALAELSMAALREGDDKAAVTLRELLAERFPGHPALDWEPLRHWSSVPAVPDNRKVTSP